MIYIILKKQLLTIIYYSDLYNIIKTYKLDHIVQQSHRGELSTFSDALRYWQSPCTLYFGNPNSLIQPRSEIHHWPLARSPKQTEQIVDVSLWKKLVQMPSTAPGVRK